MFWSPFDPLVDFLVLFVIGQTHHESFLVQKMASYLAGQRELLVSLSFGLYKPTMQVKGGCLFVHSMYHHTIN